MKFICLCSTRLPTSGFRSEKQQKKRREGKQQEGKKQGVKKSTATHGRNFILELKIALSALLSFFAAALCFFRDFTFKFKRPNTESKQM